MFLLLIRLNVTSLFRKKRVDNEIDFFFFFNIFDICDNLGVHDLTYVITCVLFSCRNEMKKNYVQVGLVHNLNLIFY